MPATMTLLVSPAEAHAALSDLIATAEELRTRQIEMKPQVKADARLAEAIDDGIRWRAEAIATLKRVFEGDSAVAEFAKIEELSFAVNFPTAVIEFRRDLELRIKRLKGILDRVGR